jgi:hypothetical protein
MVLTVIYCPSVKYKLYYFFAHTVPVRHVCAFTSFPREPDLGTEEFTSWSRLTTQSTFQGGDQQPLSGEASVRRCDGHDYSADDASGALAAPKLTGITVLRNQTGQLLSLRLSSRLQD